VRFAPLSAPPDTTVVGSTLQRTSGNPLQLHVIVARHSHRTGLVYFVQPVKYALIAAICLAACNESNNLATGRDESLAYITETILRPSCGAAECHSAMVSEKSDVFDSVAGAQASITRWGLIQQCAEPPCDDAPDKSYLYRILSTGVETQDAYFGLRMPLDQALSNSDIELIHNWIQDGADGVEFPQ